MSALPKQAVVPAAIPAYGGPIAVEGNVAADDQAAGAKAGCLGTGQVVDTVSQDDNIRAAGVAGGAVAMHIAGGRIVGVVDGFQQRTASIRADGDFASGHSDIGGLG